MVSALKEFLKRGCPMRKGRTSSKELVTVVERQGRRSAQLGPCCQLSLKRECLCTSPGGERGGPFATRPAKGVSHEGLLVHTSFIYLCERVSANRGVPGLRIENQ